MTEVIPVVDHALLFAPIKTIDTTPHHLASPIAIAAAKTRELLQIVLVSPLFDPPVVEGHLVTKGISRTARWDQVQRLLTYVYVQATKVAQEMDKVLMQIDVLLQGNSKPLPESLLDGVQQIFRVTLADGGDGLVPSIRTSIHTIWLPPTDYHSPEHPLHPSADPTPLHPTDPSIPPELPVIALGGTFDHLHAGHKILLSMAAWIASEKIIVGMTDDALLVNKSGKQVLEHLPERSERVRAFLTLFKPSLVLDIVPINDVYGPTAWDPNIQALVVSKETLPGAAAIEKLRKDKSLPALKTFVIDVISSTEASLDADDANALKKIKMSSTFIREWIIQQRSAHPSASS